MDKKLIGGVFSDVSNAEEAIRQLQTEGYGKDNVSVFAKDDDQVADIEDNTDAEVSSNEGGRGKNAGKGAGIGAASGGILGGLTGLVLEAGLLAIPGIGPIAAAGPLAATLTGAGLGAGGGGLVGALVGAGIPEEEAKQYEKYLEDGKIIVFVETEAGKEDFVYQTFVTNKTMNTSMYPEGVVTDTTDPNMTNRRGDGI